MTRDYFLVDNYSFLCYPFHREVIYMQTISERIDELIRSLGITKTAFAEKINIGQSFVSKICSGAKIPSDRTIMDICREFGVSEQWLRTGTGEMFPPRTRAQEIADFAADLLSDEPESTRSVVISYLMRWDADDWSAVTKILRKHGAPHLPPDKETEPNT